MAFLIDQALIGQDSCRIEGEDFHHLRRVLRKNIGDPVDILSTGKVRYRGRITAMADDSAAISLSDPIAHETESSLQLTIACAAIKGDAFFDNVRMFCELGAQRIVVFVSENCVVQYDEKRAQRKREKMQRIVNESCKQNLRTCPPAIDPLTTFEQLLSDDQWLPRQKILCYEGAREPIAPLSIDTGQPLLLMIGPEGGISQREAQKARMCGIQMVSLGPRILKASTAQVAALSIVQHRFGDIP